MIDSYRFGRITVDGKTYSSDVIIYPDSVDGNWWRREGHRLDVEDIKEILRHGPEVLIVGTGESGLMVIPEKTRDYLNSRGIELIAEKTDKACTQYNKFCRSKKVVAALHLTC